MKIINKLKKTGGVKPAVLIMINKMNFLLPLIPDKTMLRLRYWLRMGKHLNLKTPHTYNEKLQWLKLYDRRPEYTKMVDKIEVKDYVASIIGQQHIIPTIAVYNAVDEIDWDNLPQQFVMKCSHDSGGVIICKDKAQLDIAAAKEKIRRGLKRTYFWRNREWPYKNVTPRVIVENYMVDESGYELKDYKFFCFDGEPKALFIATDRGNPTEETKFDFFDMDFQHLPFTNGHPNATKSIKKPTSFEQMKEIARQLSAGLPHVRVDLYDIDGHIYFGELTFFHWSGMMPFVPEEWDYTFGSWLNLPVK